MGDDRLAAFLEEAEADVLVSADPGLVRMLTGHAADLETGPSPFAMPPLVVAGGAGAILVCSVDEAPDANDVESYEGFSTGPLDPPGHARAALRRALERLGPRRVLIDEASLAAGLRSALPSDARPAPPALALLGATKTAEEIAAVEAALRLCEVGQDTARRASVPGVSELDVWAAVRAAVENLAGGRCAMLADLVAGERAGEVGGLPGLRLLGAGDLVLCDLVPRLDGVWGDSCATWAVSDDVPPRAVELHGAATAALDAALAALRPGTTAGEVDAVARDVMGQVGATYPHHTGHGLGFRYHEEPRIVPGGPTVLRPGMVVALEPGGYDGRVGVRVERVAVVTDGAPRVLSRHALDLVRRPPGTPSTEH